MAQQQRPRPGMSQQFQGVIGRTFAESKPWWPEMNRPPDGSPNVLFIVLDDTGFGHLGCYGSEIATPNMDRLAANGLRYVNWHTTALCSPTRSCLLTGRNHHSNGMGVISEAATGFPGYTGEIPKENGFLSAMLRQQGYNTFAVGKWHLTPVYANSMAGPFDRWPLGQGFERFYGFLGGETSQWDPDLVLGNDQVTPPKRPEEGYHLTIDLTDKAIQYVKDAHVVAPDKPFFLYLAYGAHHAPHHVPREYIDRYRGKFDKGWDVVREETLARQKQMGLVPEYIQLPERNPLGPDVEPVRAWAELSDDERRLFARMQEVYAGFVTMTDEHIGRVLSFLEEIGELDNTLIYLVSDNGASGEGGTVGSVNENRFFNMAPESLQDNLAMIDQLGSPATYNHYPTGWTMAGNTPFKMWKRYTWEGGIADPCIVHWPKGIAARGEIRAQFHHATDLVPTVLEAIGIDPPETLDGFTQSPIEGVSMRYTFDEAGAATRKDAQYFEMLGSRAIWYDGWKAVTAHVPGASNSDFSHDVWRLYHVDDDPNELHDLAEQEPLRLREMIERWWVEAGKYKVLPLDDRQQERMAETRPQLTPDRSRYVYYPNASEVPESQAANVKNRSHTITATVKLPKGGEEGVILAQGSKFGGYALYVQNQRLVYVHNYIGITEYRITSTVPVPESAKTLRFVFTKTGEHQGKGELFADDTKIGEGDIPHTVPIALSLAGEGLCCGYDSGMSVTNAYVAPFSFTGMIEQVFVDISGDKPRDLGHEMAAAMARD